MDRVLLELGVQGRGLLDWAALVNVSAGAVLIGAYVLDRLIRTRVGASWRVLLYIAVFARVLVPLDGGPWSVPGGVLPSEWMPFESTAADGEMLALGTDRVAGSQGEGSPASEPLVADAAGLVAIGAWSIVALLLLVGQYITRRRLGRELVRSQRDLGFHRPDGYPVAVHFHPTLGPAVVGVLRPIVVIPMRLTQQLAPSELDCVLAHERAHLERKDPWLRLGLQVMTALLWPIAALWFALARCQQLVEEACDARALRRGECASGATGCDPHTYGVALLSVASSPRLALVASTFGGGLSARVRALGRGAPRTRTSLQAVVASLLAGGLIACAGTRVDSDVPVDVPIDVPIDAPSVERSYADLDIVEVRAYIFSGPKEVILKVIPQAQASTSWPLWLPMSFDEFTSAQESLYANAEVERDRSPCVAFRMGGSASVRNVSREGDDGPRKDWCVLRVKTLKGGSAADAYTIEIDLGEEGVETLAASYSTTAGAAACVFPREIEGVRDFVLVLVRIEIFAHEDFDWGPPF